VNTLDWMHWSALGSALSEDFPTGEKYSNVQVTKQCGALWVNQYRRIAEEMALTVVAMVSGSVESGGSGVAVDGILSKAGSITGSLCYQKLAGGLENHSH
jgi:hypothetical protein